ncbi:MAG: SPOR domain-containing protein [Burkholderiales bacterium]
MARTVSDEQLQFKKRARRRLIGAIALVILMVIVLPLLLDSESKPVSPDISIQIPPRNNGSFTSRVVPAAPADAPAQKDAVLPLPAPQPAKPAAPAIDKTGSKAYVVQLAAFSSGEKAKQMQQKLAASGVRAYTEVLKTAEGEKTRVRAGPYDSQEAAEKALDRLKTLGIDGVVTSR